MAVVKYPAFRGCLAELVGLRLKVAANANNFGRENNERLTKADDRGIALKGCRYSRTKLLQRKVGAHKESR